MRAIPSEVATSSSMSAWVTAVPLAARARTSAIELGDDERGRFEEIEHELGCLVDAERRRERTRRRRVASAGLASSAFGARVSFISSPSNGLSAAAGAP